MPLGSTIGGAVLRNKMGIVQMAENAAPSRPMAPARPISSVNATEASATYMLEYCTNRPPLTPHDSR